VIIVVLVKCRGKFIKSSSTPENKDLIKPLKGISSGEEEDIDA